MDQSLITYLNEEQKRETQRAKVRNMLRLRDIELRYEQLPQIIKETAVYMHIDEKVLLETLTRFQVITEEFESWPDMLLFFWNFYRTKDAIEQEDKNER